MKMRMLWMWTVAVVGVMAGSLGEALAVPPSHSNDPGSALARPRAPQSVESPSQELPALAVIDFTTVFGGVPAASLDSVLPKTEAQKAQWEEPLTKWRDDQKSLLARLRTLLPNRNSLTANTKGALVALKGEIEGWQNRDKESAWGNQIFTKEALAVSRETAELLVSYGEAYAALAAEPGQGLREKEHRAFEMALKAQPEAGLVKVSKATLDSLPSHHRDQVKSLIALRDSLRNSGNLEEFGAALRKDTRPTRQFNSLAHR